MYTNIIIGYKCKGKDTSDISNKLGKLEEEAVKREEACEMRRLEFVAKIEEKRREIEMKHEERLMRMFMTVLSQCQQHNYPPENQ